MVLAALLDPSTTLLLIPGFSGPMEILVILVVVLLLFGSRIPGVARSLGQGIIEFKKGLKDSDSSDQESQHIEDGHTSQTTQSAQSTQSTQKSGQH